MRFVLAILLLLPVACRGSHGDPTPAVASASAAVPLASDLDPDRCQYLTTQEASTLVGLPFVSGVPGRKCQWQIESKGSVVVTVSLSDGQSHYAKELQIFPKHEDLSGLGDEAFLMGPVIGVRIGARCFTISGIVTDNLHSVTKEKLVAAARAISARLPT